MTTDLVTTSELFELLTKATRDAVWHWDLGTNTIFWNEGFTTLFGYELNADRSSSTELWSDNVHPDDRERVLNDINEVIKQGGTNWADEYRFRRADGTFATVYDRGYVLHREGRSVRMVGAIQDITERVALQKERDESEERLRFALQSAQMDIWEFNIARGIVEWDASGNVFPGLADKTGKYSLPYEDVLQYIHPDDKQRVDQAVQWALNPQSGGKLDIKCRIIPSTGALRWFQFIGQTHFTEAGQAHRFSGVTKDVTAEVIAREKVNLSEQQARIAIEGSGSGSFSIDINTNDILYSPSFARIITGKETTGITRNVFVTYVHPEDRSIRDRAYEIASGTGTISYEARFIWDDKSVHWVKVLCQYLFNSVGKPVSFSGIVLDITEQKEKIKALHEAEKRFSIAFNNASVGMTFMDEEGNFTLVNRAFSQLLGYSDQELYRLNYINLTHPDDRAGNQQLFDEIVRGDRLFFNLTKRYIHKDTTERWVQVNVTRIAEAQDEIHSLMIIAYDISAEMAARKALSDSEALFRNITDASTAALWITDDQLNITYVSQKWIDWTGAPLEKHLGSGWLTYIVSADRQQTIKKFQADFHAFHYHENQFRVIHTDGSVRWVVCTGNPQYAPDGQFSGYIGAILDISDRVEAEEKLRASEERFRSMINQAPVAIGILNGRNMVVETANLPVLEIWGKDASIIGKPLIDVLPEIKGQGFMELLESVYDSGNAHYGFETHARLHRNGKLEDIYLNFVYAPVHDENDASTSSGIMVVATEVTQQVKAKIALQESEQRFRNLIEEAPVATSLFVGRDLIIELPNETMLKFWGKGNSVIGKPLHQAVPELVGQPFLQIMDDVYTTGIEYNAQEARTDLVVDGQLNTYYFNFTYKPLRNSTGEIYAVLDMAIDVTEQVMARRAIEESELMFRTLMEVMAQMTWTNTPEGDVNFYNQRWYDYTGLNFEQTKGWNWETVLHPDDLAHTLDVYKKALADGTIFVVENRYRRGSDGMYRWHLNRALPVRDEKGEITRWVGTATDIHEQKQVAVNLEEQVLARTAQLMASNYDLRRSNENLEKFAYIASHDLQEPLRKIQSFGGILKSQYAGQLAEGVDHLERMQQAASRMSLLIRDLLSFSRISTRQEAAAPISLNRIILEVIDDLEIAIQQADGQILVDEMPTIFGDESQLRQLFQNLLSNALKFKKKNANPLIQVRVKEVSASELPQSIRPARLAEEYYCISVTDNGIGFDGKYIDRIFQVFQRLHGRNEYAGTGIGLAICEKVVVNHGGAITAVSQPGQGATFLIYLPVG